MEKKRRQKHDSHTDATFLCLSVEYLLRTLAICVI